MDEVRESVILPKRYAENESSSSISLNRSVDTEIALRGPVQMMMRLRFCEKIQIPGVAIQFSMSSTLSSKDHKSLNSLLLRNEARIR